MRNYGEWPEWYRDKHKGKKMTTPREYDNGFRHGALLGLPVGIVIGACVASVVALAVLYP
jgi:hypothetical protein